YLGDTDRRSRRRTCRSDSRPLAFAVKLIKQGFELVIRDVIRAGFSWCNGWRYNGLRRYRGINTRPLAFTVQLVEQGFKFVFRDFVASPAGCHRNTSGRLGADGRCSNRCRAGLAGDSVQQVLKFSVGDIATYSIWGYVIYRCGARLLSIVASGGGVP